MYPPDFYFSGSTGEPPLMIELICCNALDQCVSNAFTVTPVDIKPTMLTNVSTTVYTIQYDNAAAIGQHFTWTMNTYNFIPGYTSPLEITNPTDPYSH